MRHDTKRKLDRLLWRRRAAWGGAGVALVVLIAGMLWVEGLDATVEKHMIGGTVASVAALPTSATKSSGEGYSVDVKLDDGRHAVVFAKKDTNPAVGQHVEIAAHVHGTGRTTFSWK